MTALTLYLSNSPATTITTADKLLTTTGGGLTNKNTTFGTAVNYGEVTSQGTSSAWAAAGTIPNPTSKGYLWDDTTLADGASVFAPGTWTATVRLNTNTSSITADMYVRVYRRASNGVYNTIVVMVLSNQTITSTLTSFTLTNTTSSASATFQPGDLVYADVMLNILTNTIGSTTALVKTNVANSSTLGNVQAQIVTPGYSVITANTRDAGMRLRFSSPIKYYFAAMRLRANSTAHSLLRDARMRLRLIGSKKRDAAMRLLTQIAYAVQLNAGIRLRANKTRQRDAGMRLRTTLFIHSALLPTATRRSGQYITAKRRQTS